MNEDSNKVTSLPQTQSGGKISCLKSSTTFSSPEFGVTPKCRNVFIKTFGCQMNVRDSEIICGMLIREGYSLTDNEEEADIILFNTCSVRQHAEDKVWSEIGRIGKMFKESVPPDSASKTRRINTGGTPRPTKKIVGLVGCMAQNYKEETFEKLPGVDFVVGPSDIHKIPEILKKLATRYSLLATQDLFKMKIWETDGGIRPEEIYHTGFRREKDHAFVVVSEGCSNFCSYCVVPYVRGQERSRHWEDILKEITTLAGQGFEEITLLGQNVNSYCSKINARCSMLDACRIEKDKEVINFADLLRMVNEVEGLEKLDFTTSHPKDATLELFWAIGDLPKLKKSLHLPLQSGSNRILKLMNRGYTRAHYLKLIRDFRRIVPGAKVSTDIIVGFPTETEKDFQDTYNLLRDVEFDKAYIFKYSPRPHTAAEKMPDDVPVEVKKERHQILLNLQREISRKKHP